MNLYTNSFFCAYNPDRDEIVINFAQECPTPDFDDPRNGSDMQREPVAGLVLKGEVAKSLAEALQNLLRREIDSAE